MTIKTGIMARLPWDHPARTEKTDGYVRERSADPYHTARWTRLSRAFRAEHPLCAECNRKGIIRPATCVDHINEDKTDNRADNLRWCTREENTQFYLDNHPGAVSKGSRMCSETTPPVSLPREVILGGKTPSKNETKWKD